MLNRLLFGVSSVVTITKVPCIIPRNVSHVTMLLLSKPNDVIVLQTLTSLTTILDEVVNTRSGFRSMSDKQNKVWWLQSFSWDFIKILSHRYTVKLFCKTVSWNDTREPGFIMDNENYFLLSMVSLTLSTCNRVVSMKLFRVCIARQFREN